MIFFHFLLFLSTARKTHSLEFVWWPHGLHSNRSIKIHIKTNGREFAARCPSEINFSALMFWRLRVFCFFFFVTFLFCFMLLCCVFRSFMVWGIIKRQMKAIKVSWLWLFYNLSRRDFQPQLLKLNWKVSQKLISQIQRVHFSLLFC